MTPHPRRREAHAPTSPLASRLSPLASRLSPLAVKWSSNFGHCSGIGCERFETRWRQSLRSRVKATMVVKIDQII
ncbi:hypothetical protein E4L73_28710, partial [Burkholderia pseudomallei]|nr:hypothetical protein [Burkholderia pseudomallei]MPT87215.1 hypothetical protein [Burkholderia pseudomallei]